MWGGAISRNGNGLDMHTSLNDTLSSCKVIAGLYNYALVTFRRPGFFFVFRGIGSYIMITPSCPAKHTDSSSNKDFLGEGVWKLLIPPRRPTKRASSVIVVVVMFRGNVWRNPKPSLPTKTSHTSFILVFICVKGQMVGKNMGTHGSISKWRLKGATCFW